MTIRTTSPTTTAPEPEPYPGLRPYRPDEAARFFGRSREAWELMSLVLSSRLVVVYGPCGVGKTSLIQAGVLGRLGADTAQYLPVASMPLASTLPDGAASGPSGPNPFLASLLSAWAPHTSPDVEGTDLAAVLGGVEVALDRYDETPLPLVAVVDQVEELFGAGPDWAEPREELFAQLERAMRDVPHLHLVLAGRHDVVGELLAHESRLSRGGRRRYLVGPLGREAALEALTRPLEATTRSWAPGVADTFLDRLRRVTIVNEVGEQRTVTTSGVQPISLQVVALALWRSLPDDVTTIDAGHLDDYGDVEAILTSFCLRAVIDVAAAEGIPEPAVWEWLDTTFITDLGTRGTAYEGLASTGGMPNAVARAFEAHRILRSEKRSGSVWFELLHDVLIEPIRCGRRLCEGLAAAAGPAVRPRAYLRMAERALQNGMLRLAAEYAQGAARAGAHDPTTLAEANTLLGELVLGRGRIETGPRADELYTTAEDHYRRAAELFDTEQNSPAVGRVLASLGRLMLERGRFGEAVGALRSALDRLRGAVDVRLDFARALGHYGQVRAAFGEYSAILTQAPEEAKRERVEALVGRGVIGAQHDDPGAALRDLDDAIRQQPDVAGRAEVASARALARARLERRVRR